MLNMFFVLKTLHCCQLLEMFVPSHHGNLTLLYDLGDHNGSIISPSYMFYMIQNTKIIKIHALENSIGQLLNKRLNFDFCVRT